MQKQKQRGVTIDDATYDVLKQYGRGNLSQGIRRAAKLITEKLGSQETQNNHGEIRNKGLTVTVPMMDDTPKWLEEALTGDPANTIRLVAAHYGYTVSEYNALPLKERDDMLAGKGRFKPDDDPDNPLA